MLRYEIGQDHEHGGEQENDGKRTDGHTLHARQGDHENGPYGEEDTGDETMAPGSLAKENNRPVLCLIQGLTE